MRRSAKLVASFVSSWFIVSSSQSFRAKACFRWNQLSVTCPPSLSRKGGSFCCPQRGGARYLFRGIVVVFIPKDSFFLSSFVSVFSVVEQEESKKADQNSEHWAEDSEPKCGIPTGLGHEIGLCFSHFLSSLVVSDMLQPKACSVFVVR